MTILCQQNEDFIIKRYCDWGIDDATKLPVV